MQAKVKKKEEIAMAKAKKIQPDGWKTTKKERRNYIIGDFGRQLEGYIVTALMSTFLIFQGINCAVLCAVFFAGQLTLLKLALDIIIPVIQVTVDGIDFLFQGPVLSQLFIISSGWCRCVYFICHRFDRRSEFFQ